MIMQLLGKSLESILHIIPGKKMSVKSACMLAFHMLSVIEFVHNHHFIHRDIKPDNFAMGINQDKGTLFILDFGLAKFFRNPLNLVQNPLVVRRKLTGTARYASIHALMGMEQSRRDDLESIAYVILYLINGQLPWQGFVLKNKEDKYAKILEKKKAITDEELCKNLPKQIELFVSYVKNLEYEENPDYDYMRGMFEDCIKRMNEQFDNIYDWDLIGTNISSSQNNNILSMRKEGSAVNGQNNYTNKAKPTESASVMNNKTIVNNFVLNNTNTFILSKCENMTKGKESNYISSL